MLVWCLARCRTVTMIQTLSLNYTGAGSTLGKPRRELVVVDRSQQPIFSKTRRQCERTSSRASRHILANIAER
jgi:hypothetical protein